MVKFLIHSVEAYHLNLSAWQITSSLFIYYCMKVVAQLSQKFLSLWFANFHSIFAINRNRCANLFSTITQPRRQLGAILWFHVIIHIFITIHHKLTQFSTHKLHVISQYTDNLGLRARHDAYVRARQNKKMLKITFWTKESTNQVILSISKRSVRTCPRARCARAQRAEKVKIQNVHMIWSPLTKIDNFHSFQSLLTFHNAVSVRQISKSARAAMGNIMQKWAKTCHFSNQNSSRTNRKPHCYIMVGKSMSWRYDFIPPWLVQSETKSSYWHLNSNKSIFWWRHFCLCSIDIIPLTGDRFSQNFWYVIADTILYETY